MLLIVCLYDDLKINWFAKLCLKANCEVEKRMCFMAMRIVMSYDEIVENCDKFNGGCYWLNWWLG